MRNDTPVTLCGELAGKPISAMALIGLGYRSISMSPASIGPVKAMMTELPLGELDRFFDDNLWPGSRPADARAAAWLCGRAGRAALTSGVLQVPTISLLTALTCRSQIWLSDNLTC